MAHGTAQDVAAHWASQMGAATPRITQGVNAVQTAPGQSAAANRQGYLAGVTANVDKWARNVAGVSLADWKQATLDKGVNRVGAGATAAAPKFATFMGALLPYVDNGRARIKAMPKVTLNDSKARANAWMDYMYAFKKPTGV